MRPPVIGTTLLLVVLLTAGCLPSQQPPAKAGFHAPDTAGRVPAIVNAADNNDQQALPELIHALSDEDAAVRLFAIRSLEQRTGQTLGYRYYDTPGQRQEATTRWHAWLQEQSDTRIALPPTDDTTD